jgi:hypothetical protein
LYGLRIVVGYQNRSEALYRHKAVYKKMVSHG